MKAVLFAYACEPGKGSEPGAGWMWARLLGRLGDTWVVTRANNREPIEAELPRVEERERLHFVWVDLPEWSRRWKRGQRGVRAYYLLWQVAAYRTVRRLHRLHRFDLVWHVSLSTAWLGSLGAVVGPPFVYGPLGGGIKPPLRLLPSFGLRGLAYEGIRAAAQGVGRYANPMARLSWRRARLILTQNPDTKRWLPKRHRDRAVVLPHVLLDEDARASVRRAKGDPDTHRTALFAGRLLDWKGPALALRAVALLPGWRLLLAGEGPAEPGLRRLVRRLGLADRVEFLGVLPRPDLLDVMETRSDLFLFPSTHDEAGWVVIEASLAGLPVVCLDVGGPPTLGGNAVPVSLPRATARALAHKMLEVACAPAAPVGRFSIDVRSREVASLLSTSGLLPSPSPAPDEAGTS